jgi:hypothetical protein
MNAGSPHPDMGAPVQFAVNDEAAAIQEYIGNTYTVIDPKSSTAVEIEVEDFSASTLTGNPVSVTVYFVKKDQEKVLSARKFKALIDTRVESPSPIGVQCRGRREDQKLPLTILHTHREQTGNEETYRGVVVAAVQRISCVYHCMQW